MIHSDLEADGDRCKNCGQLLRKHYGNHELYPTLRIYDGDIVDARMAEVICKNCGYVNELFWQAWLPTTTNMVSLMAEYEPTRRGRFAWAAV